MRSRGSKVILAVVLLFSAAGTAAAQAAQKPAATAPTRLRVFLDCDCFAQYMREEIEWVDFVRQPQDADVQVLSASNSTGGGGREVVLRFIGVGRLQGTDHELKSVTQTGETEDAQRRQMLRTMTIGLIWYVERAGLSAGLSIDVEGATAGRSQTTVADDPWKAWVFTISGGASIDKQESNQEWDWEIGASADRVTEKWILAMGFRAEMNKEKFRLDDDDEEEGGGGTLTITRRERDASWFIGRALGPHWSAAVEGEVSSSTFGNRRLSFTLAPAVEYNIFPYADYARRQLRLTYQAGVEHARYNEVTLFGKLRETNPVHEFEATLDAVQPWGDLRVNAGFRQYLNGLDKYRFEVGGDLSFRIARGLDLDLDGSASRIRDQISLPSRGATPEEILLRLRELQSGYQIDFSINLTYRFGSIFNNIVNPRFGRD